MLRPNSEKCVRHNKDKCDICEKVVDETYVFVQYYDVVSKEAVPPDGVDETLDCIRLKWDRHGGSEGDKAEGKVFALCPLDCLRGRVHVIRSNALVHILHDTVPYKKNLMTHLNAVRYWQGEMFYINRFYRNDDYRFTVKS